MQYPSVRSIFPLRIKALREAIGISQDAFAKALDVSRAAIGYYENGTRLPDIEFLDKVVTKTGCYIGYLMGYSSTMNNAYTSLSADDFMDDTEIENFLTLGGSASFVYFIENEDTEKMFRLMDSMIFDNIYDPCVKDVLYYKLEKMFRAVCESVVGKCMLERDIGKKNYTASELEAHMKTQIDSINSALSKYEKYMEESRKKIDEDAAELRGQEKNDEQDPIKAFSKKMSSLEWQAYRAKKTRKEGGENAKETRG